MSVNKSALGLIGWVSVMLTLTGGACKDESSVKFVSERHVLKSGVVVQMHGQLKHGKKHGLWYRYRGGKVEQVQTWRDGLQHGPLFTYWRSGGLLSDRNYADGEQHGRSRLFGGDDNRLTELRWWQRGQLHGWKCYWRDDGRLTQIEKYEYGRRIHNEAPPTWDCPYTSTPEGQHHFDPDDRTYERPYPRSQRTNRRIPILNR